MLYIYCRTFMADGQMNLGTTVLIFRARIFYDGDLPTGEDAGPVAFFVEGNVCFSFFVLLVAVQ